MPEDKLAYGNPMTLTETSDRHVELAKSVRWCRPRGHGPVRLRSASQLSQEVVDE